MHGRSGAATSTAERELEEILRENKKLQQENELLEAHKSRLEAEMPQNAADSSAGKRRRARGRNALTLDEKLGIANAEFEVVQKRIEDTKLNSEKLIDSLRAVLEETDLRIGDLKKEAYEFKRDIVVGAENFRTGKTVAEKVVKYMEEKLKQKDAVIEKLRLKNVTLKGLIQKVETQLKQKEEMGDVLHYIDFHQLQIENKQYIAKIEERNQDLLKLKRTTGNTVQVLNNLKKKLNTILTETEWLRKEIQGRKDLLEKIRVDINKVGVEIVKEERLNRKLSESDESGADMPHVRDYIGQKAEMYELRAMLKDWTRKVEIAAISAGGRSRIKSGPSPTHADQHLSAH
ncbi:Coiled-coil domain-containing protein 113 [Hondaea fermentalgiana]|uniref:Cilia- and flagella-associated protein 263 n=1 Tax=Hondaea fermentalgiana TaxID=2315210 RepID=A0A2R5GEA4_9STRA|nr:Coiled-coil domain-containing protein 113 [Hondaea fermentalgiana]|eukprot:GBG28885.1 Coiled-coil domain-containing protein 113 [Hondaea fermentalgiana]